MIYCKNFCKPQYNNNKKEKIIKHILCTGKKITRAKKTGGVTQGKAPVL
jgi:hypothetical protein